MNPHAWLFRVIVAVFAFSGFAAGTAAAELPMDETPAEPSEWGFRPASGDVSGRTPPSFSWRPQSQADTYIVQVARDEAFAEVVYESEPTDFTVHTPPVTFEPGGYVWRFRYEDGQGNVSPWSSHRSFSIDEAATAFPLPSIDVLVDRIPDDHPRLFVRPEHLPELRALAETDLQPMYERLVERCERLLANPPDTAEPPKYPDDIERGSAEWRRIWWGNRRYTIAALNGAATLGFVYQLSGNRAYGELARRILMECAQWDPQGSTSYRYNDEAGMPYAYYFSRTYSFVHDLLSEEQRETCREIMRIRGNEMHRVLYPNHLWQPYGSHRNRAWHFLGEIAIAFIDEIPEAEDWLWLSMNIFANNYPVWNDPDGGWHEGLAYWRSYLARFTQWADVMRAAMDIDAFEVLPFFSEVGYYPLYLVPPGTQDGGFGDQVGGLGSSRTVDLMSVFATQAGNPYWQWYVDAHGGASPSSNYINFVRGRIEPVEPGEPTDLPTSRAFRGTGQAYMNTTLLDAADNVQVLFKSSPMGTRSHGYEAQNAFILTVAGESIFIRSGKRDGYGSDHHRNWMWHTKSVNSITIDGQTQHRRSARAIGELKQFHASERIDFVEGEAGDAYEGDVADRFTRSMLFIKPDLIVIFDRLRTPEPATFEWRLHAPVEMDLNGQRDIHVVNDKGASRVAFLYPDSLALEQTDAFDPPPREDVLGEKLVQHHLTASVTDPTTEQMFVTVLRPHKSSDEPPAGVEFDTIDGGFVIQAATGEDDRATVVLRGMDVDGPVEADGLISDADVAVIIRDAAGAVIDQAAFGGGETLTVE